MVETASLLQGRKRRRLLSNPVEAANLKTDGHFVKDFLQHSTSGTAWFSQWNHPVTGAKYELSLSSPSSLSPSELKACFSLVEETSRPDYEASAGGWQPRAKLKEMRSSALRYVLIRDGGRNIRGFTSMMPTYEQGQPVVYCYEIHLKPDLRGTGLGARLMGLHITVAENLPPVEKVMLTCFLSNRSGFLFYERLGFERDAITPNPKRLRSGETRAPDYVIMSKRVGSVVINGRGGGAKRKTVPAA